MALAKSYLFPSFDQDLAHFGFVLAHPARIQIIELLTTYRVLEMREIMSFIPLSQTAVSDHIRYLERAQLISVVGTAFGTSGYKLNREQYEGYCDILLQYLDRTNGRTAA